MSEDIASAPSKAPAAYSLEERLRRRGYDLLAGVDEAGRGPLAGPVVAAAVVLTAGWSDPGVADSKTLSPRRRTELDLDIRNTVVAWGVGICQAQEIDRLNIHRASLLAMRRAVETLAVEPDYILVDGRFPLETDLPQQAVVKGDSLCRSVAAASIVAKTKRDGLMQKWHERYPVYNFAANKGYATAEHRRALEAHGPCPIHRRSYAPVAQSSLPWGKTGVRLGVEAENLARSFLGSAGLEVIASNLRTEGGELDLVAWEGDTLVFVEVKGRSGKAYGRPEEAVDLRKQKRLIQAAQAYLTAWGQTPPACRFDVLAVDFGGDSPQVRHLRDAFRVGD
ncbi:MAG: ribonuclease HII [Desulfarculaceae bacterium]|jgi:ribonuclease HII